MAWARLEASGPGMHQARTYATRRQARPPPASPACCLPHRAHAPLTPHPLSPTSTEAGGAAEEHLALAARALERAFESNLVRVLYCSLDTRAGVHADGGEMATEGNRGHESALQGRSFQLHTARCKPHPAASSHRPRHLPTPDRLHSAAAACYPPGRRAHHPGSRPRIRARRPCLTRLVPRPLAP